MTEVLAAVEPSSSRPLKQMEKKQAFWSLWGIGVWLRDGWMQMSSNVRDKWHQEAAGHSGLRCCVTYQLCPDVFQ